MMGCLVLGLGAGTGAYARCPKPVKISLPFEYLCNVNHSFLQFIPSSNVFLGPAPTRTATIALDPTFGSFILIEPV
jgi:hypothetical protein